MASETYKGSIRGKAVWAHLDKPPVFDGQTSDKLTISLIPNDKDLAEFRQKCQEVWEAFRETEEGKKKKITGEPMMGEYEDKEGNIQLTFKTPAVWKFKNGTEKPNHVAIFDGLCREIGKKIKYQIGNNSDVVIAYELSPFIVSSKVFGVSLRLQGVQILKYVPFGGRDAASMGFVKHEGEVFNIDDFADDEVVDEDDIPFVDGEDDTNDDF